MEKLLLASLIATLCLPLTANAQETLLSLNKSTTASSVYNPSYVTANAVDGVIEGTANYSWWASAYGNNQYLEIDLGQPFLVTKVALYLGKPLSFDATGGSVAAHFEVQAFIDGGWQAIATESGNTNRDKVYVLASTISAQKIRFVCPDYGFCRLREMEIYGTNDTTPIASHGGGWREPTPPQQTLACVVQEGGCDMVIGNGSGSINIDATGSFTYTGKKICIRNGNYGNLSIYGLVATKDEPATFINCGGRVVFRVTAASRQSIRLKRSQYIRITGSGSADHIYGIFADAKNGATGILADWGSSDIEFDHIEVEGSLTYNSDGSHNTVDGVAIGFKTYPKMDTGLTCDDLEGWSYGNWAQYNTNIHDNYFHHITNEGMYIGPSHFGPITGRRISSVWTWSCTKPNGETVRLAEAEVKGVRIVNNRLEHLGLDGIQVGGAVDKGDYEHNIIANNYIKEFALEENSNHAHGIQLGSGTRAIVESNWIENTRGQVSKGFADTSMGDTYYTNNVVIGVTDAIMLLGNSDINGGFYLPYKYFYHNTIVDVTNAVYSFCFNYGANDVVYFGNNIFAGYVAASKTNGGTHCLDNLGDGYFPNAAAVNFMNLPQRDLHPRGDSPALGAGIDLTDVVPADYDGRERSPDSPDLGAFTGN